MEAKYLVEILKPETHIVKVRLHCERLAGENKTTIYLPSWSPGSYLMREYARHLRHIQVLDSSGQALYFSKVKKGTWEIDWQHEECFSDKTHFSVEYEVYCHELTVRTSHVDMSHAFLHGPSYLMGVMGRENSQAHIEFRFPSHWGKLTTGLKDISQKREIFLYEAQNYDELLDCPVEIGQHITDGFMVGDKPHHLAFYGETYHHSNNLKEDIKTITEYIAGFMGGDLPYESYTYMTHFKKGLYGGLEHSNSTALQFDGRRLASRKGYLQWLCLVSHEYFHTWNIKRIRPVELGPFDYQNEACTRMLWLVEGLTSFVDELFVYQMGLCSLSEYLEMQKDNLTRYYQTPGRKFDSLEESSFDAWIKLYRPHENSKNSSVSYYLKGGLVFSILNIFFYEKKVSFKKFLMALWESYQENPKVGLTKDQVLKMIEKLIGKEFTEEFEQMLSTTIEIDFEAYYQKIGIGFEWEESQKPYLGAQVACEGGRFMIKSLELDGPAYKSGLNAGDEILAINHQRAEMEVFNQPENYIQVDKKYIFTISRLGKLMEVMVIFNKEGRKLKKLKVINKEQVAKALNFSF